MALPDQACPLLLLPQLPHTPLLKVVVLLSIQWFYKQSLSKTGLIVAGCGPQSPGLEADDIIATLALRGLAEGLAVTIASPDKVAWFRINPESGGLLLTSMQLCSLHRIWQPQEIPPGYAVFCASMICCRSGSEHVDCNAGTKGLAHKSISSPCRTSSSCCARGWISCGQRAAVGGAVQRSHATRTTPSVRSSAWSPSRSVTAPISGPLVARMWVPGELLDDQQQSCYSICIAQGCASCR